MFRRVQAIRKLKTKSATLLLIVPTLMFAMLATPVGSMGSFGSQKASAADPRGDWVTQYHITQAYVKSQFSAHCPPSPCTVSYITSFLPPENPNSRVFRWETYRPGFRCHWDVYIGNNYYVWKVISSYCA